MSKIGKFILLTSLIFSYLAQTPQRSFSMLHVCASEGKTDGGKAEKVNNSKIKMA